MSGCLLQKQHVFSPQPPCLTPSLCLGWGVVEGHSAEFSFALVGGWVDLCRPQRPNIKPFTPPLAFSFFAVKKRNNWHRHDYTEPDDGSRPVQAGTPVFIKELQNRTFAWYV